MSKEKKILNNNDSENLELDDCFIITPIGAPNSEVFKKTSGLLRAIIEPVLKEFNFKAVPAHFINDQGSINKQIIKHIVEDKLVITNLTGLNPNVMYELAVRHATKLPVITMAEHGTNLPFDIIDQRTIFYYDTLEGVEDCKPRLKSAIEAALKLDAIVENPIYDVIKETSILKSSDIQPSERYLIERLDKIENALSNLQSSNRKPLYASGFSSLTAGLTSALNKNTTFDSELKEINNKIEINEIMEEIYSAALEFKIENEITIMDFGGHIRVNVGNVNKQTLDKFKYRVGTKARNVSFISTKN